MPNPSVGSKDKRRVAIIGAGPSGLASLHAALENGLEPVAFEKKDSVGGLWTYPDGLVWNALQTNLSKFSCCFSTFAWPNEAPIFPCHLEVREYLYRFAQRNKLLERIRFKSEVLTVRQRSGGWVVGYKRADGTIFSEQFDFLIVASGIFSTYSTGNQAISARAIHAGQYRTPETFVDSRVVVIGGAFSGAEISADISKFSKSTINIIKRPSWVIPRWIKVGKNGATLPIDLCSYSRKLSQESLEKSSTQKLEERNRWLKEVAANQMIDHPALRILDHDHDAPIVVSDDYVPAIRNGRLDVINDPGYSINGARITLSNGREIPFDHIIYATGYRLNLPFLSKGLLREIYYSQSDLSQPALLAKSVFPRLNAKIAFVGIYRGPFWTTMELQARWACGVFAGNISMLLRSERRALIEEERVIRRTIPKPQFPHPDYVALSDSVADRVGALPVGAMGGELRDDLRSGPLLASHYRLEGPNSDFHESRAQILSVKNWISQRLESERAGEF